MVASVYARWLGPSSRPVVEHDKLCYAVDDLKRLSNCDLTIQDSDDPERPINFEPRVPEGDVGPVGDDIAVESESEDPELIPDKGSDPMELIIPDNHNRTWICQTSTMRGTPEWMKVSVLKQWR